MSECQAPRRLKPHLDGLELWVEGPSTPDCSGERVDIWRVALAQPVSCLQENNVLSPDESARAGRFRFERDGVRFVRCRTVLRFLLGRYLKLSAHEIRFEYSANGKPQIAIPQNPRRLRFNVSHSGDLALIAVTEDRRLGIDIEIVRADVEVATLVERFFSSDERAGLAALPQDLQMQAFYACWTRKEAFIKATGYGLSFPLCDFCVSTHPNLDPMVKEIQGDTNAAQNWYLLDLNPEEGYRATVAVEGLPVWVKTYRWK